MLTTKAIVGAPNADIIQRYFPPVSSGHVAARLEYGVLSGNPELDDAVRVSDQALLEYLRTRLPIGLDGIWHPQVNALAQKFGVERFDVNRWWCLTPVEWMCPGCGRPKADIVRVNQHHELMCHLVEHHDHMDRFIEKCLGEYVGRLPSFFATLDSERFARRSSLSIAAFDQTIICEDCNNVETKAKKVVGAHPDFSFTARDIRSFVIARPNLPHDIDDAKLRAVWKFREEQLQRRFGLARQIVELAATNEHWYEQADELHHAERVERMAKAALRLSTPRRWDINIGQFESVSALKPLRRSAAGIKVWRTNKRLRASQPPNAQELKWATGITHGQSYQAVPDQWRCPWCQRSKAATVRPSKQFKWSFGIRDPWIIDLESGRRSKVIVCQDCADVRIQIAKEANAETQAVQPIDVITIIQPEPHAQHTLAADSVIDVVVKRVKERAAMLGLGKGLQD